MYKNITTITKEQIEVLNITAQEKYDWVDKALRNMSEYVLPIKTRIPLKESDYFNVMPCVLPSENVLGLKVVTRSQSRRDMGGENIEDDILVYSYEDFLPLALVDGAYITTLRTAAVAVHSLINFALKREIIAMVGLGSIGTEIGNILFELLKDERVIVKLFRYKDHAEKFARKFGHYSNIRFEYCDTYEELMANSDVVVSSVTFIADDFCSPSVFKKECTVIPVHLRGFKECDKEFDHIITSDLVSIKKFQNYDSMKKLSYINDLIQDVEHYKADKRTIIYNLGLAVYDLFYASKIIKKINETK